MRNRKSESDDVSAYPRSQRIGSMCADELGRREERPIIARDLLRKCSFFTSRQPASFCYFDHESAIHKTAS